MKKTLLPFLFCIFIFFNLSAQPPQFLYDFSQFKYSFAQGWNSKDSAWSTYQRDEKTLNSDCQILTVTTIRPAEYNFTLSMYRDSFVYDNSKRVIKYYRSIWDNSAKIWNSPSSFDSYFYINNQVYPDSILSMSFINGVWKKVRCVVKKFNSQNQIIEILEQLPLSESLLKTVYAYNTNHKLIREKSEGTNPIYKYESIKIYNNLNLLIQSSSYSGDSLVVKNYASRNVYKYDDKNRLIEDSYQIRDVDSIGKWVKNFTHSYKDFNKANMPFLNVIDFHTPNAMYTQHRTRNTYYNDSLYKTSITESLLYGIQWHNTYRDSITEYCGINTGIEIQKKQEELSFSISPNPSKGQLLVKLPIGIVGKTRMNILTITGQIVKTFSFMDVESAEIDVSNLSSGIYFMKLQTENKVGIEKFIIQH